MPSEPSPIGRAQVVAALAATGADGDWLTPLCADTAESRPAALAAAAAAAGYAALDADRLAAMQPAFETLHYADMVRHGVLLLRADDGSLHAVLAHPFRAETTHWLSYRGLSLAGLWLADPVLLRAELARHEAGFSAVAAAVDTETVAEVARDEGGDLSLSSIQGETSPVVRMVKSAIFDALRDEASDIHLETDPAGLVIKFRIDGVLTQVAQVRNPAFAEQVIARVKVLADLDIGERRIPQDGRFRVAARGRDIDIRVSIMPSIHGEDAVLRILDKQALIDQMQRLTLDSLGFDATTIRTVRRLAAEPYGMLLVTGPTGSGKTTTLYAALSEINRGEDKIITIEDPVEYQLGGVLQIPVNERKGLTFAVGLRSILRHDPDKILVGEIRDPETAQIAVQAALTGHLVFTSVHANNTFDVIGRFMHMGVDPYNFVSSLSGVIAQRLVRQNCPNCSEAVVPKADLIAESAIGDLSGYRFRAGAGCAHCRGTGFRGRRAIAEVLRLTDTTRELIVARAPIRQLKAQAGAEGTRFLREAALDLVRSGDTTLQEANRVTFVA